MRNVVVTDPPRADAGDAADASTGGGVVRVPSWSVAARSPRAGASWGSARRRSRTASWARSCATMRRSPDTCSSTCERSYPRRTTSKWGPSASSGASGRSR